MRYDGDLIEGLKFAVAEIKADRLPPIEEQGAILDAADEIERLREESATWRRLGKKFETAAKVQEQETKRLKKRIEELEKDNQYLSNAVVQLQMNPGKIGSVVRDCIFIPRDKIREAWEYAPRDKIREAWEYAHSLPAGSEVRISIFYALRLLNIVRCEGCGGSGEVSEPADHDQTVMQADVCPDCNGEGWVKEGGASADV